MGLQSDFRIDKLENGRVSVEMSEEDFRTTWACICEIYGTVKMVEREGLPEPPGREGFYAAAKSLYNRLYKFILNNLPSKN